MIPLSIPNLGGKEWQYIKECLDTNWVSSVGSYVSRFEEKMAAYTGTSFAVSAVNGTAALHLSLIVAGVNSGDAVIVPNITFIASSNAVIYTGAEPIFVDVDAATWQMNIDLLASWLAANTYQYQNECRLKSNARRLRAVMPVHVLGNMCEMDKLMDLAQQYNFVVVEDASESLGSYYKGVHSGGIGHIGVFSFNGNKIMTTGGGGMIVTNNETWAKQAKFLSTQAKTDPLEYFHEEIGYNYRLVNVLAAMGVAQLEQMPSFLQKKANIATTYTKAFAQLSDVVPQHIPAAVQSNNWLYTLNLPSSRGLLQYLQNQKIQSRPLWTPMNQLPMFTQHTYVHEPTQNVSKQLHERCLSIPCSTNLSPEQQQQVIDAVQAFYTNSIHYNANAS